MNAFRTTKMNLLLMIGLAAMLLAVPALAGDETTVEGVLHVKNGTEPEKGNEVIKLEEVWRHGGEDDEDFFGMVSQCVVGDDGTIYLLDTRTSEVPVYSPDGERLDTLSRQGDGPGETRTPSGLLFTPDGNLGIVQVFPGRVTKIATDGTPVGVVTVGDATEGGFMQMFDCVSDGKHLIVTAEKINPGEVQTQQGRVNFVAAFDDEGNEITRYYENAFDWDFMNFTLDESELNRIDYRKVAAGKDGRVYIAAQRDAYQIDVYSADGTLERVITRDFEHRQRTDEELARVTEIATAQLRQIPNAKIVMAKTEPDIGSIEIGGDGNLWVTTSMSGFEQPEGILATWDVFTPDGHFLKTVSAACEGDGENDIIIWTPEGNAVMVTGFTEAIEALQSQGVGGGGEDGEDEAAPMEVIYLKAVS